MSSIHPNAVHWTPSPSNVQGKVRGYESEIGSVFKGVDGRWHATVEPGSEDLGDFKTQRKARQAIEKFVANGYEI